MTELVIRYESGYKLRITRRFSGYCVEKFNPRGNRYSVSQLDLYELPEYLANHIDDINGAI